MAAVLEQVSQDYGRVERAIRFLEAHRAEQPDLARVAQAMELSPFHAQRVFSRWAGVTPKQFLGLLTLEHAKERLRLQESVMEAAWDAGLSGPSRLHDLFVRTEAITPGEYRRQGSGLVMRWGVHATLFGDALLVLSERGLARLAFVGGAALQDVLDEAREAWPLSSFVADPVATAPVAARIFARREGDEPLRLLLKGTPFQIEVWRALLRIPEGGLVSYRGLARQMGRPGAVRAVGTACGANRLAWLVPCHRVIRETGALGGYHWGPPMKRAMLAWEQARSAAPSSGSAA